MTSANPRAVWSLPQPRRPVEQFAERSAQCSARGHRRPSIARFLARGGGMIAFDIDGGVGDLRTVRADGKARSRELPLAQRALACYEKAIQKGLGQQDLAGLSPCKSTRNFR